MSEAWLSTALRYHEDFGPTPTPSLELIRFYLSRHSINTILGEENVRAVRVGDREVGRPGQVAAIPWDPAVVHTFQFTKLMNPQW